MDLVSSGCRKSLDQLLEQAMAERSREDDQVEVTYEMKEDYACDQRAVRLKPDDQASATRRDEKDDVDEESESGVGSIQMEKKVMKSTIILSVAMVLCFSGFSVVQSFLSTTVPRTGLQALTILYIFAIFSSLFAPILIQKIGPKWIMVSSGLSPIIFIIIFKYNYTFVLIVGAILVGLLLGPTYRAQKSYLFRNISRLSFLTQSIRKKMQQRFLRVFFIISKSYCFWGHLIATIVMEYINAMDNSRQQSLNETIQDAGTVARRIDTCFTTQCKHAFLTLDFSEASKNPSNNSFLSPKVTEIFVYVFSATCAVGVLLVVILLEKLEVLQEQDPLERSLLYQTLRQIKLLLIDQNVSLVVLMIVFTGIEQAFIFGDFTRDYISCALGLESIGFTMICMGGCHTLGSIGVHLFSQHFQRPIIMAAGLVCQSGLLMVLWLWTPVKDDAAVFYVIAGGWGLCNAVWETLLMTFLATAYPDDWQTPLSVYYQLQWLGMSIAYSFSNYFCSHIKILILAVSLAVSIIPYTILEFRLHHRNHVQNRTDML